MRAIVYSATFASAGSRMNREAGARLVLHLPNRIVLALIWLVVITLVGSAGYVVLEHAAWSDALYMTVITISTVGFDEAVPLGTAGRIWTVVLIMSGVGTALYLVTLVAQIVFDGGLGDFSRRIRMRKKLEEMNEHVILAGYGRFGKTVIAELEAADEDIVVIDKDASLESELIARDQPFVLGTATQDEVLERAGIGRARAIVIATSSDADNVFITLSARELAPKIRIHARGEAEATLRRLRRAGADHVVSPYQMGGIRTAAAVIQPTVVNFVEVISPRGPDAVSLEEIRIEPHSSLEDRDIRDVELEFGRLRIVALKQSGKKLVILPEAGATVGPGDRLVVIGERDSLVDIAEAACRCAPGDRSS